MANILRTERTANKITLGTTGTTINIASHTASKTLALDGSKNLESIQDLRTTASPTFAGLTIVNTITEFSTDGTMGGDSDSAVPTEKATKLYTDTLRSDLASTNNAKGASLIGVEDSASLYTAANVETALAEVMDKVTPVTTTGNSITTPTGTVDAGDINSTITIDDADTYDVSEVTGAPGFDIQITFTGIASGKEPNKVQLHIAYDGSAGHNVDLEMWNYTGSPQWDVISADFLPDTGGVLFFYEIEIPGTVTDYISSGEAKLRFNHTSSGNANHDVSIDFAALKHDLGSGAGVTEHGALSGLGDDDHLQYLLVDGTRALTGNLIVPNGGTIGQAAGPLLTFDDTNNYLSITGCKIGFGITEPQELVHLYGAGSQRLEIEASDSSSAVLKLTNTSGSYGIYASDVTDKISIYDYSDTAIRFSIDGDGKTNIGPGTAKTLLTVEGTLTLKEQAAADGDTAAYGQDWVKNTSPCTRWFTDDAGGDHQLGYVGSGTTLAYFIALNNEPPSANGATADTRNSIPVLDFDADAVEWAEFGGVMPRNYTGGGVTVTIGWMATDTTVTPHDVFWAAAFKSVSNDADDLDTKAYAANNSAADEEASVSGEVSYCEIAFTDGVDMDSVAAGEYFRLRIERTADSGSDTLTDDAELVFVEIRET